MTLDRRTIPQGFAASAALGAMMNSVQAATGDLYVIADLAAKPEAADQFRQILVDFVAMARKENGCKHYTLLEDPAQAGHFHPSRFGPTKLRSMRISIRRR